MTNYRDKFLGSKTVKVNTKEMNRKNSSFLKEELDKVSDVSMSKVDKEIESTKFVSNFNKLQKVIRPYISHNDPSTFAFYGSAETYYKNGFDNITNRYPYDGSRNERIEWSLSASALDVSLLQHVYPKATGSIKFAPAGTGSQTTADSKYQQTNTSQFLSFDGGPRVNSTYSTEKSMGTNLSINPVLGNTVEFWLKKESFENTYNEVILDVHTPGNLASSNAYGRILIEMSGSSASSPFVFSYCSASSGFINQTIGSSITPATIADNEWHHYALTVANEGNTLQARLYIDGKLNDTITTGTAMNPVVSNTTARIGALGVTNLGLGDAGWGQLSASVDHFRFWRAARNPKEIGMNFDRPVYGGTPKDSSNPYLGVYFKFNEGITGISDTDSTVLDFSGRVNNAIFEGYIPENRSLESAITLSNATTRTEQGDPIIIPTNNLVKSKKNLFAEKGRAYDRINHASLLRSLPQWVYDEDVFGANKEDSEMGILVQAIANEFDQIKTLIDSILRIKSTDTEDFFDATSNIEYGDTFLFGCADDFDPDEAGKRDNSQLSDFILSNLQMTVQKYPMVLEADHTEHFYSESEKIKFSQETKQITNKVLKNVYNNIAHIYKTKGTEQSFRNMIRCFGVGEDLIRLNVYANNEEREIKSEPVHITIPKKSISFEGDNSSANVIQQTGSAQEDVRVFISGTQYISPWSSEASFIFPTLGTGSYIQKSSLYGAGLSKDVPSTSVAGSAGSSASGSITLSGTPGVTSSITIDDGAGSALSEVTLEYRKDKTGHGHGGVDDADINWKALPVYTMIHNGATFGGLSTSTGGFAQLWIQPLQAADHDLYEDGTYNGKWRTHWSEGKSEALQIEILDAAGQILYIKFQDVGSYDSPVTTHTSNKTAFGNRVKRNGVRDYSIGTRFTRIQNGGGALTEWLYNVAIAIADTVERGEIKLQIPEFCKGTLGDISPNNIAAASSITYYADTNAGGPLQAMRIAADSRVLGDGTGSPLGVRIAQNNTSWSGLASGSIAVYAGAQDVKSGGTFVSAPQHYWNGKGPTMNANHTPTAQAEIMTGSAVSQEWLFAPGGMPGGYSNLNAGDRSPAQNTLTQQEISIQTAQVINNLPANFEATVDGSVVNITNTVAGTAGNAASSIKAGSTNVAVTNPFGGGAATSPSTIYGLADQIAFNVSSFKFKSGNKSAYFKLTSSTGLFEEITSSNFPNVYDNSKWNFAVVASKNSPIPFKDIDTDGYKIEFIGKEYDLDVLRNSFHLSGTMTKENYERWSKFNKSFYMGAERDYLTGSVITHADTRGLFLNVWADKITTEEIKDHAVNPHNIGRKNPQISSTHNDGTNRLNLDSLALSWRFDNNPSFESGVLTVTDASSGSLSDIKHFGDVIGYRYPGRSTNFSDESKTIKQEHLAGVEYVEVDNAYTSDRVKIKDGEFEKFQIDSRPTTYTFSFEKSLYQIVSKDMLNFVAGLSSYNNLIGEPVNKYRQDYKALQKLTERYFSSVNAGPDLEKFVEYYRWIDASLGSLLTELQPASSKMRTDLKNVVESHAFERNKYAHPFPTVEFKNPGIPVAPLLGVNELLYDWEHGHGTTPTTVYGGRRTVFTFNLSVVNTSDIAAGENLDIEDGEGTVVRFSFVDTSGGASPFNGTGALQLGTGNARPIAFLTTELATKINATALNVTATASGNKVFLVHDNMTGNIIVHEDHADSDCILGSSQGLFVVSLENVDSAMEAEHCLWQKDRKEHTADRNAIRDRIVTQVSGSTYVLRNLTKPYKYSVDRQEFLIHGSNRKTNKIDDFYKVINSGNEIFLSSSGIYEFKKCDDVINPQRERIYTTKADTSGTGGYLDADGDLLLPFTLYSSSAGTDFSVFKQNMVLTNNHDDLESSWAQSPFVASHNGGMPHRRVPFGTANKDRPEAYEIEATSTRLTIKAPTQKPKSMFFRDSSAGRLMNVANIKSTTGSLLLGNYKKDYEIVMTSGRSINNNYLVDTEGSFLASTTFANSNHISGGVDFAVPNRGKTEHVIVNRFSAPGGPDSMGAAGLDRVAEEYSVNNTINYRNSTVRNVQDILSGENSELHGYRKGSTTQASIHMTNRNPMRFTGSLGNEVNHDNFFVQHPIPQHDFSYAWITASAAHDVYTFISGNANSGHQHMFNLPDTTLESKETITFLTASELGLRAQAGTEMFYGIEMGFPANTLVGSPAAYVDFVGLNSILFEPLDADQNSMGFSNIEMERSGNHGDINYINHVLSKTQGRFNAFAQSSVPGRDVAPAFVLNNIILNRQGPYGWPTWKQIRGADHPIMRLHRKNNTISTYKAINEDGTEALTLHSKTYPQNRVRSTYREPELARKFETDDGQPRTSRIAIANYTDMPATNRFNPMVMTKHRLLASTDSGRSEARSLVQEPEYGAQWREQSLWFGDEYYYELATQGSDNTLTAREATVFNSDIYGGTMSMRATLQNDVTTYSNREIINAFKVEEMKSHKKDNFLKLLSTWFPRTEDLQGRSVIPELREVNYVETLYPKEVNTFSKNARTRQDFVFYGWNSDRAVRERILTGNINYAGPGTFTGHTDLVAFPEIDIIDNKDFIKSSLGRVDMVNMGSTGSLLYGNHLTSSTWVMDARKDFTSLPVGIDFSFRTAGENFLLSNLMGTRGEGLLQNDYGIFAMGYNGLYGTPPLTLTYNRRIPQEVTLYENDFQSIAVGTIQPSGWTDHSDGIQVFSNAEGNRLMAFHGARDSDNRRFAKLDTTFTGATLVKFDLFAAGGALGTEYGYSGGSQSDRTPTGKTFDIQYALTSAPSTWITVRQIAYEASMKTSFKQVEAVIPVAQNTSYNIRLSQLADAGTQDKWGVDNFRVVKNVLSGEAKFQTADTKLGPFYNSYEEYRDEIRLVGQDHSILPEFKISDFVEEYYNPKNPGDISRMRNEYLSLTGAIFHTSSGNLEIGSQFFKTYGNSEFMKYFGTMEESLAAEEDEFSPTRLTLRCQAAMKFLPYKGFFPAERVEQIGEIFARAYMPEGSYSYDINNVHAAALTENQKNYLIKRRIEASKQQAMKPLFGPGVLNNSIKAGLAVDYPIFDANFEAALTDLEALSGDQFLTTASPKTAATAEIRQIMAFDLNAGDFIDITALNSDGTTTVKRYHAADSQNVTDTNNMRFERTAANALTSLKACIENANGHNSKIIVTGPTFITNFKAGVATTIEGLVLTQAEPGQDGNIEIVSSITSVGSGLDPLFHTGFSGGSGGGSFIGFAGSEVNETTDLGIPRLSGSVSRRIDFDDLLYADDLYGALIHDNEPHPSASLLYGNSLWNKVVERPARFGNLHRNNTLEYVGVDFDTNRVSFGNALTPFKSAIHNFASETVSFFLKDQKLETVMTPPVKLEIEDDKLLGKEYKMRVYLQNANTTMYDRHSAFGPPVDDGHNDMVFYETGAPVTGSGTLTIASSVTALTAAKNGEGASAPTHAELSSSANPRIVLSPINGEKEVEASGSIIFYDPANYYNTIPVAGTQATVDLTFDVTSAQIASVYINGISSISHNPKGTSDSDHVLNTTNRPAFDIKDTNSKSATVTYYDPNDYIRYTEYTRMGSKSSLTLTFATPDSIFGAGADGSTLFDGGYVAFKLTTTNSNSITNPFQWFVYYDSSKFSSFASITGFNDSSKAAYDAFSGDSAAAIAKYATKVSHGGSGTVIFINVYDEDSTSYYSASDIAQITKFQINGSIGASSGPYVGAGNPSIGSSGVWVASNSSANLTIKFDMPDENMKFPDFWVPVITQDEPNYDFTGGIITQTSLPDWSAWVEHLDSRLRAQWTGTAGTDSGAGSAGSTTGYIVRAGQGGSITALFDDDSAQYVSITETNLSTDSDRYRFISARTPLSGDDWDGFDVNPSGGGSLLASTEVFASNSISAQSGSHGDYVIAFNGARATLPAENKSTSTRNTQPAPVPFTDASGFPADVKCNGFALTNSYTTPFVVTFDYTHPLNDSTNLSRAPMYNTNFGASAKPTTRVDFGAGANYGGLHASNVNEHLFAQYRYQDSGVWSSWITVMEIVPDHNAGTGWRSGGFAISRPATGPNPSQIPTATMSCQIRFVSTSDSTSADHAVWLIRNIIIHDVGSSSDKTNLKMALNTKNVFTSLNTVGITVTQPGGGSSTGLRLTQDTAGATTSGLNGIGVYSFFGNVVSETSADWSGGADASSYKTYYDVTGSEPGHDTTNNIRYCAIRGTGSAGSTFSTADLRTQLKFEIDQLNSSALSSNLTVSTESTNKIVVEQVFGGEEGNNDPGPGEMKVANGSSGSDLSKVLTDTANSIFTGGGTSTDIRPITRSVADMHGFMPYVPPYLDRNASPYVEYTFVPRENKTYNAVEIVDQLTASYYNFHRTPPSASFKTNYNEAMSLTASLNLNEIVLLERDRYVVNSTPQGREVVEQDPDFSRYGYRWVMQPRWETPVHDFQNVSVDALRTDNNTVTAVTNSPWKPRVWSKYYDEFQPVSSVPYLTASTGMWHQLGDNLKDSFKGYYMRIEDVDGYESLASAVGFLEADPVTLQKPESPTSVGFLEKTQKSKKSLSVKLGKLASKKNIKEAVVAIPYYLQESCGVTFFDLNQDHYASALEKVEELKDQAITAAAQAKNSDEVRQHIEQYEKIASISGTTAESTIAYQLRMMERYVLPPMFDFRLVDNEEVLSPFVMYFFEFNAELNEKDLSNIWQNIYPESHGSTASPRYSNLAAGSTSMNDVVYSSHILDSSIVHRLQGDPENSENLSNYKDPQSFVENEVRWLVFKCKYRAEGDFSFIRDKSVEPTLYFERKAEDLDRPVSIRRRNRAGALSLPMSFNWPYDYFSFVELVKLESKVDFYAIGATEKHRDPTRNR